MEFTKMHGAGNDYVVIDGRDADMDWSALALSTLERHVGIGRSGEHTSELQSLLNLVCRLLL